MMINSTRRFAISVVALSLCLGACTSWQRVGNPGEVAPEESLLDLFNPQGLYQSMGRMVGTGAVPFVATAAFLPGSDDSTRVVIGVSLGNRAFSFNRVGDIYEAAYRVEYVLGRAGMTPITVRREDVVKVANLDEALRSDESILLQQELSVAPGDYDLTIRVTDKGTASAGVAIDSMAVPEFTKGSFSAPVLVYQAQGRGSRGDSLNILLNPRGAIAYGADSLLVYFEGVGFDGPATVPLEVHDQQDSLVLSTEIHFTGSRGIESEVIHLASDSIPLGRLEITVGSGTNQKSSAGIVSFSGNWVITNFDALLSLLRYFPYQSSISEMRNADDRQRAELWREFYKDTDPNPLTSENERLDVYLSRLAMANARFQNEGIAGWRTDRGEVFVLLGPPDDYYNATATQQGRYIVWSYTAHRLELVFEDATGFGRYRMTTESRSDLERVRARLLQ